VDRPEPRKIHATAVPRVGGIAIMAGSVAAMLVWLPLPPDTAFFLASALLVGLFGLLDDRLNLGYRTKFLGQVVAALIVVVLGGAELTRTPFIYDGSLPGWFSVPFTVFVIVGVTNAVNLSDGMDGLAGGTSLLATGALGLLAWIGDDRVVSLLALCLMGATLGFLRYNTFPARVFMGDAGSQFLGFSVAVLAILTTERANTAISPMVPLLVLGLPILDTLSVLVRRLLEGRPPFAPDRKHLHHRLLDLGLNQYEALLVIYAAQILLLLLAAGFAYASDVVLLLAYVAFAGAVLGGLCLAERRVGGRVPVDRHSWVDRIIDYLRVSRLTRRVPWLVLGTAVPALFVAGPLLADTVPADIGWLALAVLVLLVVALLPGRSVGFAERLAAYALAVVVAYLVEFSPVLKACCATPLHGIFVLLAVMILIWMRFADSRGFRINGLDVLVMVIVAVVPQIPLVRTTGLGVVAMEALVLFYACEILLVSEARRWDLFRAGLLAGLAILAIRGLWPGPPAV
jgi:UDP-GlcNAc:undecaprenyl-phosphate GlcNAc-1-phosphate transferase